MIYTDTTIECFVYSHSMCKRGCLKNCEYNSFLEFLRPKKKVEEPKRNEKTEKSDIKKEVKKDVKPKK